MNRTADSRRLARGFTLVELCAAVGVSAALLGQAVPAMTSLVDNQRLKVASATLGDDLRFARAEAQRLNTTIHLRVSGKGENACYILHTGTEGSCDCAGATPVCTAAAHAIKVERFDTRAITIASNVESMGFHPYRGTVSPGGSIDVRLAGGKAVRQVVALTGRVRTCYSDATVAGLRKC